MADPTDQVATSPLSQPPGTTAGAITRASMVMGAGTTLSRVTGFVRLAVMAWAIGGVESKLPDTYQLANTLPNIVYQLILGEILATIFVPVFVEYVTTRSRDETQRLASTMVTLTLIIGGLVSIIAVLIAPWLIRIYTFRLEGAARLAQEEVGTFFLRLFMPQMVFYASGTVLTGLLNAHKRFGVPMFAPVLNNLTVIGTFVAFKLQHGAGIPTLETLSTGDKLLLAGGTTAGIVIMTLALLPSVFRLPQRYRLVSLDLEHPALRKVGQLARYALLYVVVNQVGLYVVKLLANGVQGGVAAYDTAFILYTLPYGIVAVSVFTALVPTLSEHHVKGDVDSFREDLSLGLRMTSFVMFPAAAGFVALSEPIIRLLLEYGVFSARSTALFSQTFAMMAVGLWAYAAFIQIMKAFVSMQDTRTPWIVNSGGVAINIAAALPLFLILGVPGLGLAHALAYMFSLAVAVLVVRRRIGGLGGTSMLWWHFRVGVAALLTGVSAWGVASYLGAAVDLATAGGRLLQVGAAVAAGIISYLVFVTMFRIPELRRLTSLMGARLKGKS